MRIFFISIPSSICYNIGSGILRATGNSRSPMIFQLIGGITNVFANWVLIVLISLGVALATLFSSTIPAVICVRALTQLPEEYRLEIRKIRITPSKLKSIFLIGIPNGIQAMVITLSNLIVQANINSLDVTSIAAFTCYFKLENFVYLPIMAFGQAATTFVAQNMGRGFDRRARKGMGVCLIIGVIITVCISSFLLLIHDASKSHRAGCSCHLSRYLDDYDPLSSRVSADQPLAVSETAKASRKLTGSALRLKSHRLRT